MKLLNSLIFIIGSISCVLGTPYVDRNKNKDSEKYVTIVHQDKYKPSFNRNSYGNENNKIKPEPIPTSTITFKQRPKTKWARTTSKNKRFHKFTNDKKIYRRSFFAPTMTKVGDKIEPTFGKYVYDSDVPSCVNQKDCQEKNIPDLLVEHLRDKTAFKPSEKYYHKTLSFKPVCTNGICKAPIITELPCMHGNCRVSKENDEDIKHSIGNNINEMEKRANKK
ncbi:hypothetical protein BCR36DRAFT_585251 [Piromyces finnis]|uniref:Uncharacterized protein n=1 Tax=Piromyces finnis TaxID=1754191 RepID=A0A1Y1V4F7_9FUNG|nr:hypothetical protein BCR36DRAFT_585251 [Piromyces finnis]|eukprot:ORX46431.1 hypothetical protein BCR36DRAFT_585251 [Piromyces finnis]